MCSDECSGTCCDMCTNANFFATKHIFWWFWVTVVMLARLHGASFQVIRLLKMCGRVFFLNVQLLIRIPALPNRCLVSYSGKFKPSPCLHCGPTSMRGLLSLLEKGRMMQGMRLRSLHCPFLFLCFFSADPWSQGMGCES